MPDQKLSFGDYGGKPESRQREIRRKFLELIHYTNVPEGEISVTISEQGEVSGIFRRRYMVSRGQWDSQPIYEIFDPRNYNGITLIALHGHGNDPFSGIYSYVMKMPRYGYRVIAPILYGYMERETRGLKPDWKNICREWSIEADALGVTLIAARLYDAHLAYELALKLEEVDDRKIATLGLSMGGEISLYLAALEPGIAACVSAGFLSSFRSLLIEKRNCQCYSIRDWPRYFDMVDIAGCIAPRPVQIQKGVDDPCLDANDAMQTFEKLRRIYTMFNHEDGCDYVTYPGGHVLNQQLAHEWFGKQFS